MRNQILLVLLGASLLLNAMAIGGFVYVRYYAAFHLRLDTVAHRLDLDAAGRERLLQFRRDAWSDILGSRRTNAAAVAEINDALATKPAGDPAIAAALDHLSTLRRARQEKLVVHILAFRDGLPPASRARFTLMAQDQGFLFELLGLRVDNMGP